MNMESELYNKACTAQEPSERRRSSCITGERPRRPGGVTLLSVINFIGGVLYLIVAVAISGGAADAGAMAAVCALLGLSSIALAVGLWALCNWARVTAVVLYGLSVLFGLFSLLAGSPAGLVQIIVAGFILSYLCGSQTISAFKATVESRSRTTALEPSGRA